MKDRKGVGYKQVQPNEEQTKPMAVPYLVGCEHTDMTFGGLRCGCGACLGREGREAVFLKDNRVFWDGDRTFLGSVIIVRPETARVMRASGLVASTQGD